MCPLEAKDFRTIGTKSVVAKAVNTNNDKCSCVSRPISRPIEAKISSTVPLPFMLIPTINDSPLSKPDRYAPPPAPTSFPSVAASISAIRKKGRVLKTPKLALKATLTMKIGPKKP